MAYPFACAAAPLQIHPPSPPNRKPGGLYDITNNLRKVC